MGSGGTCYAFLGEDQTTVLKLFKHHHLFPHPLLLATTFPGWTDKIRIQSIIKKENKHAHKRLPFLFKSCKLAYEHLREETGLLYLTLNRKTECDHELTLIDKWGIRHQLKVSQTEFALQKYAPSFFSSFEKMLKNREYQKASETISSFDRLIHSRASKAIGDRDPNLLINYGILGKEIIEIDIGSFFENPSLTTSFSLSKELFFCSWKVKSLLEKARSNKNCEKIDVQKKD